MVGNPIILYLEWKEGEEMGPLDGKRHRRDWLGYRGVIEKQGRIGLSDQKLLFFSFAFSNFFPSHPPECG